MIKIFTGENRGKILEEIRRELGEGYEVFEGEGIVSEDLASIFFGMNLFEPRRRILIRDLGENKEVFAEFAEKIEELMKTEAKVILFETKLDKRLVATKKLVKAGVEIKEFKETAKFDTRAVFGIYDLALRDGAAAIEALKKIEVEQDPFMFVGLLATQALRKLEARPRGIKERKVVKELALLDVRMKSSVYEPWVLIESFLLRLKSY